MKRNTPADFDPTASCDEDDLIFLFQPLSSLRATDPSCSANEVCSPPPPFARRVSDPEVCVSMASDVANRPVNQRRKDIKRRKVCFESQNDVHVFEKHVTTNGEGKQHLWYSRDELNEIKRSAKRLCTRTHDLELALNYAYMHTSDATEFVKSAQQLINNPFFEEQRGLERWTSQTLALSRGLTLLRVKTEVFLAQASQGLDQNGSCEDKETSLAKTCAEVNEPALKYAQLLGLVDSFLANV